MVQRLGQNRLLVVAIGILFVGVLLYVLRGVLFPFVIGGILAYVLHPLVLSIEAVNPLKKRWPGVSRSLAILLTYLIVGGIVVGALVVIIPPTIQQAANFMELFPAFLERARVTVEGWNEQYASMIPEEIRLQIENALREAGSALLGAGQNLVARTFSAVSGALTIIIGLAVVPVFLYYMLKDRELLVYGLASQFPPDARVHIRNVISVVNDVWGSYVRAQLFLGLVVGTLVTVGLFFLDIKFAIWLGVIAGLFELVPIIGPWIGAIPGVLVTLATSPGNLVWVILVYLGVQLLENGLLVPRIQGRALDLHPVVIITVIVVGGDVAGLWGVVLGPPLLAAARAVFDYFRQAQRFGTSSTGPEALEDGTPELKGTEDQGLLEPSDDGKE